MSKSHIGKKGFWLGKNLSEETKRKLSNAFSGKNNPNYGKFGKDHPCFGRKTSEEIKRKMSEFFLGENNPNFKGYIICVSGEYIGKRKSLKEWCHFLQMGAGNLSNHLSGKIYKNGIRGNFFKWENEL